MLVPTLLLIASLPANAAVRGAERAAAAPSAIRADAGSSVEVNISARIIRASGRIGAGFGPPQPRMVPRRTTVSAADGRPTPALIYDFE